MPPFPPGRPRRNTCDSGRHPFLSRVHFWSWTVFVLLLGYGIGTFLLRVEETSAPSPVEIIREQRPRQRVPVVHVTEINDGKIVGIIGTGARLVIGNAAIIPKPDRTFETPASPFLVNIIDVEIPHGALYVASRRGKKYYPVDSAGGKRLVPENRIYFRTSEEAEAMGYRRGQSLSTK